MQIEDFHLETYLAKWEFKAPYLLCTSDPDSMRMHELLDLADAESRKIWDEMSLSYTQDRGHPVLLSEIAKLYPGLKSENIQTFAGAEEGIFATMHSILAPGDQVVCISPAYQSLFSIAESIGCKVIFVPLSAEQGWRLDLEQLKSAVTTKTKLIVINFPNNPTGALITHSELDEIIVLARNARAYLFSDEVYRYLEVNSEERLPPVASLYEKGFSLNVLSKSFGLAGLRVGWVASQDLEALPKIRRFKHYLSICNSAPSEALAIIALRAREQIQVRIREILQSNRKDMEEFFNRHKNLFSYIPPRAGTIAFPALLKGNGDSFAQSMLEKAGVLIAPGSAFKSLPNHFRIGFGRRDFRENLRRLEDALLLQ